MCIRDSVLVVIYADNLEVNRLGPVVGEALGSDSDGTETVELLKSLINKFK